MVSVCQFAFEEILTVELIMVIIIALFINSKTILNILSIILTFVLFTIALFVTGFTKDLLLEAGVLLVSIKIILMGAANRNSNQEIIKQLNEIYEKLQDGKSKEI